MLIAMKGYCIMTKLNETTHTSRRTFLKGASFTVGSAALTGLLVACGSSTTNAPAAPTSDSHDMTAMPATTGGGMTAEQMDAMHEAGVKAFVGGVKTAGTGNQPLVPRIE